MKYVLKVSYEYPNVSIVNVHAWESTETQGIGPKWKMAATGFWYCCL